MTSRGERRSRMLGLVGAGIGASLTPALHEREAREQALALAYRLIDLGDPRVAGHGIGEILPWAIRLGFDGLNVTHPAKQAVAPLLDELSEAAALLGAVNTVVIKDGRTTGHNTDWSGYARSFALSLPEHVGDRMVLLGAGGAGSAVAYATLRGGAEHLTVVDPDADQRNRLLARLEPVFGASRISAAADPKAPLADAHGLINATPIGMVDHPGLPLAAGLLRPELWVSDVVYFPLQTRLVSFARQLGCTVVSGGGMAVFQAADAFELFTGLTPDAARMSAHFAAISAPSAARSGRTDLQAVNEHGMEVA
ncbi:shikimate dehydrogenase [Jatrophihabitans telluris]|uniref:Shikimate dehydrogenase n=1 Tax=Jatrophihabitans telluris TaxID=2038343 RepID=A0ABY4R1E3_9ACTN|nr:shikimate dehydrogenase [Jatrophihabitans telluris]UQX89741.1 shikimate dehydrogenase [Jatrophihabitans telluris]